MSRARLFSSFLLAVLTASLVAQTPVFSTAGTDWQPGDVFVGVGSAEDVPTRGKYLVLRPDGVRREILTDRAGWFTGGCGVDVASGQLWTTSYDANIVTRFEAAPAASGAHNVLDSIRLQKYTGGNSSASVGALTFDAQGNAYMGTAYGTNRLLKLNVTGKVVDQFDLPRSSDGVTWLDLASDQHTLYYTSADTIVRRYDLAARKALPDFAQLIDGSIHALRLLPNDQGLLVAGSVGITRLDLDGNYVTRYWLPAKQFYGVAIAPDGRSFWTTTTDGLLYRFDIASEKLLAGPIATGFSTAYGMCVNLEYTAAEDVCRTVDEDGLPVQASCPVVEICSNLKDDDLDGLGDEGDPDCRAPLLTVTPQLDPLPVPLPISTTTKKPKKN